MDGRMACVHSSKQDFVVPPRSLPCGGWKCVLVFLHKCTDLGVWRQLLEPQAVAVVQLGGARFGAARVGFMIYPGVKWGS